MKIIDRITENWRETLGGLVLTLIVVCAIGGCNHYYVVPHDGWMMKTFEGSGTNQVEQVE